MRIISLVLLLALGSFGQAVAEYQPANRETLRGIKTLKVIVADLIADVIKDGLTIPQIRTDVELRLRKAGVVVVDDLPQSNAYLTVSVNATKAADGTYAYTLIVSLRPTRQSGEQRRGSHDVNVVDGSGRIGGKQKHEQGSTRSDSRRGRRFHQRLSLGQSEVG